MKLLIVLLVLGFLPNVYGQTSPKLLTILEKDYSDKSNKDGRWVFDSDIAEIEKIEKTSVKAVIKNFDFYIVTMINYLGYHINQATCLVLVDSSKSKTVLVEPWWYGGVSKDLVKMFIRHKFESKDSLLSFMTGLHELMQVGSGYRFLQTSYTDSLITYDLCYFKGDSYTTGGNGTSSTINHNKDGVWRQIQVQIKDFAITKYIEINPVTNDKIIIK